jgi:hypothetical protein
MKTGVCRPGESAVVDGFDDLECPTVPGSVNPAGPGDEDLHSAPREVQGDPLRFELAEVIGVLWVRRGAFVGDYAGLDRADDAGRAGADRLPDAGFPGRPEDGFGSSRVDLQERFPGKAGGAEGRGQME